MPVLFGHRVGDGQAHDGVAGLYVERAGLVVRYFEERFAAFEHDVAELWGEPHSHCTVSVQAHDAAVIEDYAFEAAEVCGVFVPAVAFVC